MSEHDLWPSAERARHRLTVLHARLENEETALGSLEIRSALRDLQEMLEVLQARYGLLREILARTSEVLFAKDLDGRYVMINGQGAGMFGKSVEEMLDQDDTTLFDRESAQRIMVVDRAVMSTGRPQTLEETFDLRGVPTTLLTTKTAWYESRGTLRGLMGSAQDVTERRRAERGAEVQQERLRSLASEVVIAEECLRQSLAAELHDGLGQDIALTKMKLSALRGSASDELRDSLSRIERLLEQADRSLRSITFQLGPPSVHDLGLVPALQWLVARRGPRRPIRPLRTDRGRGHPRRGRRADTRDPLPRSARAPRPYGDARTCTRGACVAERGGRHLAHHRRGRRAGFDPAVIGLQGHGLFGIREQLRPVGGSMHIDAAPGRGTTVTLTAPLATGRAASTRGVEAEPLRLGRASAQPPTGQSIPVPTRGARVRR